MGKGIIIIKESDRGGKLQNENGKELPYVQDYSTALGLEPKRLVRFDVYFNDVTKEKTAYNVELYKRGKIIIIKDTDRAVIEDPNYGQIEGVIPFAKERGIEIGTEVKYQLIPNEKTVVAVYIDIVDASK